MRAPKDRPDLSGSEVCDEEFDDTDRDLDGVLLSPDVEEDSFGNDRFNRGDDE